MRPGARTPEELEALLEDAFVIRDREAIAALFERHAILVMGDVAPAARGGDEIVRAAAEMWARDLTYFAAPRRVLQARDTALVLAEQGINVLRRGDDRTWRYAIALLGTDQPTDRRKHDQ